MYNTVPPPPPPPPLLIKFWPKKCMLYTRLYGSEILFTIQKLFLTGSGCTNTSRKTYILPKSVCRTHHNFFLKSSLTVSFTKSSKRGTSVSICTTSIFGIHTILERQLYRQYFIFKSCSFFSCSNP